MLKGMTRAKLTVGWFAIVALMIAAMLALSVTMTLATAVMLAALCLVPPGIIFALWPTDSPRTIGDVLRKDA